MHPKIKGAPKDRGLGYSSTPGVQYTHIHTPGSSSKWAEIKACVQNSLWTAFIQNYKDRNPRTTWNKQPQPYISFHVSNVPYGPGWRGPHASDKKFLKFLSSYIAYYLILSKFSVEKSKYPHSTCRKTVSEPKMVLALWYLHRYKMNMGIIFPTSSSTTCFSVKCEQRHDMDSCGVRLIFCFCHLNCNMWTQYDQTPSLRYYYSFY